MSAKENGWERLMEKGWFRALFVAAVFLIPMAAVAAMACVIHLLLN